MTVKERRRWRIQYNLDYSLTARITHIRERAGRIAGFTADFRKWGTMYPTCEPAFFFSRGRCFRQIRTTVETWRLAPDTTNKRILSEMERETMRPANLDEMIAWLTRNAFWLRNRKGWGHPLFIVNKEILESDPDLSNALVFFWLGHMARDDHIVSLALEKSRDHTRETTIELLGDGYLLLARR